MSKKSKSTPPPPPSPDSTAHARRRAAEFKLLMWREGASFVAYAAEVPLAVGVGATPDACVADTVAKVADVLLYLASRGENWPKAKKWPPLPEPNADGTFPAMRFGLAAAMVGAGVKGAGR